MRNRYAALGLTTGLVVALSCAQAQVAPGAAEGGGEAEKAKPTITITVVPDDTFKPGEEGLRPIAGTVGGVKPEDHRVVLYAYDNSVEERGRWWVQPWKAKPYTAIGKDSNWRSETHGGYWYAALLVRASYDPPREPQHELPKVGGDVLACDKVRPAIKGENKPQR